jgi:hyperosmotically inducible periplasmic protein
MKKMFKMGLGVIAAAMLAACAGGPNSRSTGEVIDDATILGRTKTALLNDGEIKGTRIDVDVDRGAVTLNGIAGTEHEKQKAADVARGVPGVRSVTNNVKVQSASGNAPESSSR